MADQGVVDKTVGELPAVPELYDDSLLVVEQQGEARRITGALMKKYARESTEEYVERAKASADAAAKSEAAAEEYAKDAAGATLTIAETVTGEPGSPAKVENVGTPNKPALKFTIPLGNQGPVSSVNGGTGDVVIGGRNLYTGTKDFSGEWNNLDFWEITDEKYKGLRVIKRAARWEGPRQYIYCKVGEKYTVSAYVRTDPGMVCAFQFYCGEDAFHAATPQFNTETSGDEFNRLSATFQIIKDGYITFKVEKSYDDNIPLYVCGIKVELGTVATDWTPAPEDKADVPTQFDVFLPASGWINGSQTVVDVRFIDGDNLDWDVDVKGACIPWDGITITEGQMVARADIVPVEDMTWVVTRREVRRDG